jgi:hypothetical protein
MTQIHPGDTSVALPKNVPNLYTFLSLAQRLAGQ